MVDADGAGLGKGVDVRAEERQQPALVLLPAFKQRLDRVLLAFPARVFESIRDDDERNAFAVAQFDFVDFADNAANGVEQRRAGARDVSLAAQLHERRSRFGAREMVDAFGVEDRQRKPRVDFVGAAHAHHVFVERIDCRVAAALHGPGTVKQNVGVKRCFGHSHAPPCRREARRQRAHMGLREARAKGAAKN
ncbi:MAG TPA: hypothetical protein VG841_00040 [Caulobacterales bacterium]|nr:hypothetical protein [Caulobacterales bacterium]